MLDLLKDIIPVSIDIVIIFIMIYLVLLPFIAAWKLFQKAGISGWKSLIPIYNVYLMFKIVGMPLICIIPYITYIVLNCIYDDYTNMSDIFFIIILVVDIIYFILDIVKEIKLGKAFGKSKLFILGLILLSPIFEIILGMGKSKYVGRKSDVVK